MKRAIPIIFVFFSCNQGVEELQVVEEIDISTTIVEEISTTMVAVDQVEVKQLDSFSDILFDFFMMDFKFSGYILVLLDLKLGI